MAAIGGSEEQQPVVYCRTCGHRNEEAARFCSQCGRQMQPGENPPQPEPGAPPNWSGPYGRAEHVPNYLALAILVTAFGFLFAMWAAIPGIVAIVYAAQIDGKVVMGDISGALRYSRNAKIWTWAALAVIIVSLLFYAVLIILIFVFLIPVFLIGSIQECCCASRYNGAGASIG